jgi:hypothetical protein
MPAGRRQQVRHPDDRFARHHQRRTRSRAVQRTEPAGDSVSVLDVTLKFYTPTGSLLGAIDGQQTFRQQQPWQRRRLASPSWSTRPSRPYVNGLLANGPNHDDGAGGFHRQLCRWPGDVPDLQPRHGGHPDPEPETYALMLAGLGAMGFVRKASQAS